MKGGTGEHSYATNSHYQVRKHSMMNCDDLRTTYYFDSYIYLDVLIIVIEC